MLISDAVEQYDRFRADVFRARDSMAVGRRLALALLLALATGILAQVRLPLPWTPVPVTGQVLAVLLSGVILGGSFGAVSQVMYLFLGAAGLPWFNGFSSGIAVLGGPTGGYLLGFVPAAFLTGHVIERFPSWRTAPRLLALMSMATVMFIYIPGMVHMGLWHRAVSGFYPGPVRLLMMGAVPFLPGEAVKICCAGSLARVLGPPPV